MVDSRIDNIKFFNRKKQILEEEIVFKEKIMRFLFNTILGNFLTKIIFSRKIFSKYYGSYYDQEKSTQKIPIFIKEHNILMDQFEDIQYQSFNDFFIRKFNKGLRPIVDNNSKMSAFCEGRYLGYKALTPEINFPIKGKYLNLQKLLNSNKWDHKFSGGPILISRLAPQDYHRFHFPDNGKLIDFYKVSGNLNSVNPLSLKNFPNTFIENERNISILETENFGDLLYIEIGAFCVGKIIQTNTQEMLKKGQEKGYFLFGGYTVVLIGESGKWTP